MVKPCQTYIETEECVVYISIQFMYLLSHLDAEILMQPLSVFFDACNMYTSLQPGVQIGSFGCEWHIHPLVFHMAFPKGQRQPCSRLFSATSGVIAHLVIWFFSPSSLKPKVTKWVNHSKPPAPVLYSTMQQILLHLSCQKQLNILNRSKITMNKGHFDASPLGGHCSACYQDHASEDPMRPVGWWWLTDGEHPALKPHTSAHHANGIHNPSKTCLKPMNSLV